MSLELRLVIQPVSAFILQKKKIFVYNHHCSIFEDFFMKVPCIWLVLYCMYFSTATFLLYCFLFLFINSVDFPIPTWIYYRPRALQVHSSQLTHIQLQFTCIDVYNIISCFFLTASHIRDFMLHKQCWSWSTCITLTLCTGI